MPLRGQQWGRDGIYLNLKPITDVPEIVFTYQIWLDALGQLVEFTRSYPRIDFSFEIDVDGLGAAANNLLAVGSLVQGPFVDTS